MRFAGKCIIEKRRTVRVINYENAAVLAFSSAIAVDRHAIQSCSNENDLGEVGYKFSCLKEDQVNFLMGYDINKGIPLFAQMFRGANNDKSTIGDLDILNGLINAGQWFYRTALFAIWRHC